VLRTGERNGVADAAARAGDGDDPAGEFIGTGAVGARIKWAAQARNPP